MEETLRKTTLIALAVAALPTVAIAAPAVAASPLAGTGATIKVHVNGSQAALKLAVRLSASGHADQAFVAFRKSRTELGSARAGVIGLLKAAKTPVARTDAAKALALLGKLEDTNISKLTALLDDVAGPFQKAVAKANLTDTAARDRAIGILQALLPGLPGIVQGPISTVIGSLMGGNGGQVKIQAELLSHSGVTPDIKKIVSQAIGTGLQGQAQALVGIQSIIGAVPGPAQQQLQSALDMARAQTMSALDMVQGILKNTPVPPGVASMISGILGQMQGLLNQMFGMFAPAAPAAPATPAAPASGPAAAAPSLLPDLGGILKCVFPSGLPNPASLLGGGLGAGFDPTKIAGCLTGGLGVGNPGGIVNCIFPSGLPTGASLPAGFDPSAIASCVLKSVPDPMGILKNMPDPSGILNCVFPGGLPNPASLAGGALPAGFDPTKIASCVMGGSMMDPTGIMKCVFPGGTPTAGLGAGILPAGFDPFSIAGCVMKNVPFLGGAGGGLIPNPMQLVSSFMGGFNPFNFINGFFGGGTGGTAGGGFLGGLLPF
jgi:hypothetical protein